MCHCFKHGLVGQVVLICICQHSAASWLTERADIQNYHIADAASPQQHKHSALCCDIVKLSLNLLTFFNSDCARQIGLQWSNQAMHDWHKLGCDSKLLSAYCKSSNADDLTRLHSTSTLILPPSKELPNVMNRVMLGHAENLSLTDCRVSVQVLTCIAEGSRLRKLGLCVRPSRAVLCCALLMLIKQA